MKRIYRLLPPWIAALFATAFLAIMPMAYYLHLSSCHHGHGENHTECCHGNCSGALCHSGAPGQNARLTSPQGTGGHRHDASTCPICQGMAKLHQVVRCQVAGLFMRLNRVTGPAPPHAAPLFLAVRIQPHPRAPPA